MKNRFRNPIVLVLPLFFFVLAAQDILTGKVIAISDGDTFTLLQGKEQIKIRLNGVDCPEKSQAYGQKAKQFASDKIFGKTVQVISHGKDRYGRVIGEVLLEGGASLNQELVKNGFAWWYRQYAPKDETLRKLEETARIARIGLWNDNNPVEPWNYRKHKKKPAIESEIGSPKRVGENNVYLNMKSKKYHCRSCKSILNCKNCVLVPLERAVRDGVPCGSCGGNCTD